MTKGELKKCEGLMYDAIIKANNFKKNYAAYERLLKDGENVDAECKLRLPRSGNWICRRDLSGIGSFRI